MAKDSELAAGRAALAALQERAHGLELANRCLVSLSLFYDAMEKRWQRHGSPAPDFYRKAGKRAFAAEEKRAIADHFEKWEAYCGEVFA